MGFAVGHLCWFEDFDAREKHKPKGVIDLREVKAVYLRMVDGEGARGEVLHLDLETQVYMFGDAKKPMQNQQWKDQIEFVMKQMEKAGNTQPGTNR